MKILTYSDLHLEFKHGWKLPANLVGDVLVLAGDIITFSDYEPLSSFLKPWGNRPVLYVAGNHEFYTKTAMTKDVDKFKAWLENNFPNAEFLQDTPTCIEGVHFFGGTMWTDFKGKNPLAMAHAQKNMNDFRLIMETDNHIFTAEDSIKRHERFVETLTQWFKLDLKGSRVVISHHAPVINPYSQYLTSPLQPAFNSLDMVDVIEKYQPEVWIYGHTHECDDQMIGRTQIISNQLGYPNGLGGYECTEFDLYGRITEIKTL